MQEFTDLINYCYQQYTAIPPCSDCAMGNSRKNECEDCYNCLKHVHSYSNHTDHYSCKKITYNYILKHGHRYASEIEKAIADIKPYLDRTRPVYILSVGCGPSTELYGAVQALNGMTISYMGIDRNPIWNEIQNFNIDRFGQTPHIVQYTSEDFFSFIKDRWADILILNYFFSDLIKFSPDITDDFINKLADLINNGIFKWVVINDIPLFYKDGTGYICMEHLAQKLSPAIKVARRHFATPNDFQPIYGTKLPCNLSIPIVEQNVQTFNPFESKGSIQLIIKVNHSQK